MTPTASTFGAAPADAALIVPAKVQRLDPENPLAVQYLCRITALFAEDEWTWKSGSGDAHVFADVSEADQAAAKHGGWPAVLARSQAPQRRTERPSMDPAEVFAREERRRLA